MVIKINYTSSDVYVSTSVSPVYVVVNYSGVTTGGGVWGQITGTLSNQTDLQNALNAKFDDPTGTTAQYLRGDGSLATFPTIPSGTVTSVGLTMPSAFSVANSPITSSGTLAVTGAGTSAQYVRGDGQLANFPTNGGGGSSVNYYLNGSVTQGTFGGDTYYEMSKTPVLGAGSNFTRTNAQGNGYIASFITDAGDPALLNIPGGNWNLEFYFQSSASGGSPQFYGEVYKVDASNNFTLVASGSTNPEGITNGTTVDQYFTSIPVPQTSLLVTDRLAIRIYVITSGRTITLHTENGNLCEVLTTFSTGLNALNGLTAQVQYFATGTSGTDFAISSATDTHTFNLPTASATNRGALSSADWTTFNNKQNALTNPVTGSGTTNYLPKWTSGSALGNSNLINDASGNLGLGVTPSAWTNCRAIDISTIGSVFADGFSQNNQAGFATNAYRAGAAVWYYKGTAAATYYAQDLGTHKWYNAPSGTAGNAITFTQAMTLTAAGRLLLGTTTESTFLLDVNGTARVSGNTNIGGNLVFDSANFNIKNNTGVDIIAHSGSGVTFNSGNTSSFFRFLNFGAGQFSMYIFPSTNIGINTATDAGFKLDVNGTARVSGAVTFSSDVSISGVVRETVTTNRQTASYTLALTDNGKLVEMNVATANNLTVPLNSSVAFPIGTKIDIAQYGAGQTTVVATSGVTVRSAGGALKLAVQYSGGSLVKIATDEWYLFGDITV